MTVDKLLINNMSNTLLQALEFFFGCWHRNVSRPFTLSGWTYEVCLNCGRKFAYDRVEIGCIVAAKQNLAHRGESMHEVHNYFVGSTMSVR
jgi:hypothetical protein